MSKGIPPMQKAVALKYAKIFCFYNGYDFERIKNLRYVTVGDAGCFCFEPVDNGSDIIMIDNPEPPRPVLAVQGDLTIETFPLLEELKIKQIVITIYK